MLKHNNLKYLAAKNIFYLMATGVHAKLEFRKYLISNKMLSTYSVKGSIEGCYVAIVPSFSAVKHI